ncbi:MAG TPA: tetratricopeptide repeat protein [Reyranellaceae bacterium]|nr:tetratricopeptide repeat protein [Reyranellaceae bacterium]
MAFESLALARRAIELDPTDAVAQAISGLTKFSFEQDYTQGRLHALEAVRLNPNSAIAWGSLGHLDAMGGNPEAALEEFHRAMALSPYDSQLGIWFAGLAAACFGLGRHEEGIGWARKSIQQNPGIGTPHRLLAAHLAALGRLDEAREVTARRDAVQRTTLSELRAIALFRHRETMERYLAMQREIGVPE